MIEFINNFYIKNLIYVIFVVYVSISILKYKQTELKELINFKNLNKQYLIKLISFSFVIRVFIEEIIQLLPIQLTSNEVYNSSVAMILVNGITLLLIAPFFEEIIFRYGIYNSFNKKMKSMLSIMITSLIFATIHLYKIDGFILLSLLSIIWNYCYYKTNNLIYAIILHFEFNLYAFIINLMNPNKIIIIMLVIVFLLIFIISTIKNSSKKLTAKTKN